MTVPGGKRVPAGAIAVVGRPASAAQRDRRRRMLDATVALAAKGGYDAVQMRAVAGRAGVALGTLYRYFPSKVHILVSALTRELERAQERVDRAILRGDNPYDRLMVVIGAVTKSVQRDPRLTGALTRAFMFADASAAAEVEAVGALMDAMFARAMSNDEPSKEQLSIARVISDVWWSNLVAWVTGRATAAESANQVELAVALLLGRRRSNNPTAHVRAVRSLR
jgi:AcrR family transcriptional regulator